MTLQVDGKTYRKLYDNSWVTECLQPVGWWMSYVLNRMAASPRA